MARLLVGLSGGVDSSVACALLQEQGHEVVAAYMKNWVNEEGLPGECPWESDIEDAYAVASKLGIEFRVVDLVETYKSRIVEYLIEGYRAGYTPNPDVLCNREMKFGVFLDYALEQGFEGVGTGHYARIRRGGATHVSEGAVSTSEGVLSTLEGGISAPAAETVALLRGADPNKDQSYFLSLMKAEQARYAYFPVGELLKPEVRACARRFDLPTAEKKDSQGICFIGKIKMSDFLRHHIPDNPGEIVDCEGKVLGMHPGLHLFTIGQRKGHGVASPRENIAYVVVGKDVQNNRLIVGYEGLDTPGLYARRVVVSLVSRMDPNFVPEGRVEAQPRYRALAEPAMAEPLGIVGGEELVRLTFARPIRALAAGQVCAFYQGGRLLAGGFFREIEA